MKGNLWKARQHCEVPRTEQNELCKGYFPLNPQAISQNYPPGLTKAYVKP